jgi:hypothetical protein
VRRLAVAAVLREAGITAIDSMDLFLAAADPISLFALRMDNHPNIEGHALLARRIIEELARSPNLSAAQIASTEVQP